MITTKTLNKYQGETVTLCFDFTEMAELKAGEEITAQAVDAVPGLTIGTPTVNDVEFDGVPVGKGVLFTVSTTTAGTYVLQVTITTDGGSVRIGRGGLVVNA